MSEQTTTPENKLVFTVRDVVSISAVLVSVGIAAGAIFPILNSIGDVKDSLEKTSTELNSTIDKTAENMSLQFDKMSTRIDGINERLSRLEGPSK